MPCNGSVSGYITGCSPTPGLSKCYQLTALAATLQLWNKTGSSEKTARMAAGGFFSVWEVILVYFESEKVPYILLLAFME